MVAEINLESNLVRHARHEMELLGCNEEDIVQMCSIVSAFADVGASGGQASWMIPVLYKLLCFENLTDLTNDPKEWIQHEEFLWQSTRRAEAFSHDGGRHYYLLSEGASATNPQPLHKSSTKR